MKAKATKMSEGRKMNARVPVTEKTRKILKDFVLGLGADDYDSAINFLLERIKERDDEREMLAGYRLRAEYEHQQRKGKK